MRRTAIYGCRHSYQQPQQTSRFSPQEKKRLYILAAVLLVIALAGMALVPGAGGIALYRQHRQVLAAQEINAKLRTDNEQGQKSIDAAEKNPDYLEEISRGAFNLVQRDEIILEYAKKK